jgi:hypothetical protein
MAPSHLLPTGCHMTYFPVRLSRATATVRVPPKKAATSRFQNSTFSQVVKMLFIQTTEVGKFLVADDLACESETWLYVVQLICKQSF